MKEYKGIEIEGLDKPVRMAHSRFFETNEGLDYFEKLIDRDKRELTPEQFDQVSRLNSVANMGYQVCNGGLEQMFENGYHLNREPFNEQDVAHFGQDIQVEMLSELLDFGEHVFPEQTEKNDLLKRFINEYADVFYEEEPDRDDEMFYDDDGEYHEPDDWDGLHADPGLDDRYYAINGYVEKLIEGYAQFLDKSIDKELARRQSLDALKQEARGRIADKERDVPKKESHRPPELGL